MIPRIRPELRYAELLAARFGSRVVEGHDPIGIFAAQLQRLLQVPELPLLTVSGRAALYLLFRALPLERIYLPAYTCWVVLEAAKLSGKLVEFLDIDYPGVNVMPEEYARIADHPGIVVATHQFGYPENVPRVREILGNRGHVIIEDCAGSLFSRHQGQPTGVHGDAAIYSFELSKVLTIGGGAVVTSDEELRRQVRGFISADAPGARWPRELARILARKGLTEPRMYGLVLAAYLRFRPPTEGMGELETVPGRMFRTRFSETQARLGLALAPRLSGIAKRRQALFELYHDALASVPGVRRLTSLPGSEVCPIRVPFLVANAAKLDVYHRMRALGIDLGFSFSYSLTDAARFPRAARLAGEILNLPIHSTLEPAEALHIVECLKRCTGPHSSP